MMHILESAAASPWVYLVLFAVAVLDAFFPVVPAETMVITAGGQPNLALVILVAAAGAFAGDHVSYQIGRTAGQGLLRRMPPDSKRRAAYEWASRALQERGGLLLVVARYIPGGRTAATMTTGAAAYPRRRFALFDAIAAVSWALYSGLIGYLGGRAFEDDPLRGLLLGLGIAVSITVAVEAIRLQRRRTARPRTPESRPAPGYADRVESRSN
ncbi:membrane protein DedA with SNARE-associated domain [Hamadaea flava]|uniref:DedA family protein n=1 Tax=Hamadaea flava TaxID=1742688 RepID=A0ABV8LX39_9ACTN|nr:DedA family protein [Hamadaea flava]MCP2321623.1 membrane protein DedA with SNARE-associated domain [Hamadaea flava]